MYQGEPTKGIEFYHLLEESEAFTSEMGKVTLASGELEAVLIFLFKHNSIKGKYSKANLGSLINIAEKHKLLDKNTITALKNILRQRNYIAHNIYALFNDQLDETILEKNDLLDSDVLLYVERAWQLKENLLGLAEIIRRKFIE